VFGCAVSASGERAKSPSQRRSEAIRARSTNPATVSGTPVPATAAPAPTAPKPKAAVYIMGNPEGRDALRMAVNTFLVKSGKYQMVAVDAIDVVAKEQQRQGNGSVSDEEVARMGYDAGAQYVCVVERTELDGYSYVATRMISVESKVAEFADMVKMPQGGDVIEFIQWQIGSMLGLAVGPRPGAAAPAQASNQHSAVPPPPPPPPPSYKRLKEIEAELEQIEQKMKNIGIAGQHKSSEERMAEMQPYTKQMMKLLEEAGPEYSKKRLEQRMEQLKKETNLSANTTGRTITIKTVKIGNQVWMAENLNIKAGNSWCYENDNFACNKYGRLYDWNTAKMVCPNGWHLPSRREWNELTDAVGGSAGNKLKAQGGWMNNGNGTNDYAFSALPGGYRGSSGGFDNAGNIGYWWTATEIGNGSTAFRRYMKYNYGSVGEDNDDKTKGYSVRCVRDE